MAKFHINAKGVPAPCHAIIRCPFGGESGKDNHYNNIEDAAAAADKLNSEGQSMLPDVNNSSEENGLSLEELSNQRLLYNGKPDDQFISDNVFDKLTSEYGIDTDQAKWEMRRGNEDVQRRLNKIFGTDQSLLDDPRAAEIIEQVQRDEINAMLDRNNISKDKIITKPILRVEAEKLRKFNEDIDAISEDEEHYDRQMDIFNDNAAWLHNQPYAVRVAKLPRLLIQGAKMWIYSKKILAELQDPNNKVYKLTEEKEAYEKSLARNRDAMVDVIVAADNQAHPIDDRIEALKTFFATAKLRKGAEKHIN